VTPRRIVFVIFDGLQPIDLVGPHEVFSYAGMLSASASPHPNTATGSA
jgi:hypothetical protein